MIKRIERKMKKKYDPLRITEGTKVRILNPAFVLRVGYENNYKDVKEKVENSLKLAYWKSGEMTLVGETLDKLLRQFVNTKDFLEEGAFPPDIEIGSAMDEEFGPTYHHSNWKVDRGKLTSRIASLMAYQIVGLRLENANQERKLFIKERPEFLFDIRKVRSVSYNKIGTRSASQYYRYHDCEDYQPAILDKERTVKILHFDTYGFGTGQLRIGSVQRSDTHSIEAQDVEVVIEILDKYKEFTDWYEKNASSLSIRQQIDAINSMKSYFPSKDEEKLDQAKCIDRCIAVFVKNLEEVDWTSPPFEECHTRKENQMKQRDFLISHFGHHFTSKITSKVWGLCSDIQREHLFREALWDSEFIFDHFETLFFSEEEKAEIRKEIINNARRLSIVGDRRILSSFLNFETYVNERAW